MTDRRRPPLSPKGAGVRALASLFAGLSGLFVVGALILIALPDAWKPWTPLDPAAAPNAMTGMKLSRLAADPALCRAFLREAGVRFEEVADRREQGFCAIEDGLRLTAGGPPLSGRPPVMRCGVAAATVMWWRHGLQPAAREVVGARLTRIDHLGTYACRRQYGRATGPISQHALANALDVQGFRFADGTRIALPGGWRGEAGATATSAAFLDAAQASACRLFHVTLGPEANAAHRDHFHLDMGPARACR